MSNCKFYKQKEQKYINGSWVDTGNYRKGELYEYDSPDCVDYNLVYFTTVPLQSSTFTFNSTRNTLEYSLDSGATWTSGNTTPTVQAGNKVYWRGTNLSTAYPTGIGRFSSTGNFEVEGNVMSLHFGNNFVGQTNLSGKQNALEGLFSGCTNLIASRNLSLPATSLDEFCYHTMFLECSGMTSVPSILPATSLESECYSSMFNGCSSITTVPTLPATTLADYCYNAMFAGCNSLTSVPNNLLPATTMADNCYNAMFWGCQNLEYSPELPATTLADKCYFYMFGECQSLVEAPNLPATTLAYQCYARMFYHCQSLTTVHKLSATTLADACYLDMFSNCENITSVPSDMLPATTLADYCYQGMFGGCIKLVNPPDLPAPTLTTGCYKSLFYSCVFLNNVKCLATNKSASECTKNWLQYVNSTGTFTKAASASWPRGVDGIPNNWTIQNA